MTTSTSTDSQTSAVADDRAERRPQSPLADRSLGLSAVSAIAAVTVGLAVAFVVAGDVTADPRVAMLLLAGPVAAVLGAVAVTRFEWFVLVVLAIRPSLDAFSTGGLGPGAMLAAVFVVTGALWLMVQYRSGEWQPMSIASKCLVVFAGAAMLSVLTSALRATSAVAVVEIVAGIAMFLVLEQLLAGRRDRRRRLVVAVLVSGVVPVLVGFYQWLGGDVAVARSDLGRVQGTFVHPNPYATYLVMLILLTTSLVTVLKGRQRVILICYLVAQTMMLVVTYNRASWIAAVVGLAYVGAKWNKKILAVMGAGLVVVVFAVPSVGSRIGDLSEDKDLPTGVPDNSLEWRIQYWERLIPLANESPLTGIGPQVVLNTRPEQVEPHNVYVQAYVEMGGLGFGALVAVVFGLGLTLSRRRSDAVGRKDQALATGAIGIALAVLAQSPSENLLNQTMTWWFVAATCTFGYNALSGRKSPRVDPPPLSVDAAIDS